MRPEEREAILREAPRATLPRERRSLAGLAEDVRSSHLRGMPLPLRLRNFTPTSDGYLAALGGPLPYMQRLREIDALTGAHERSLEEAWRALAHEEPEEAAFAGRWRAHVSAVSFDEVNDLIERHNRWYPAEARLAMDPKRGDYALVNGRDYRRRLLDVGWALERFPADVRRAAAP